MESIQSPLGFYGWKCRSYFQYILGLCPYENNGEMALAGEHCNASTRGMFLVATNSISPFAKGRLSAAEKLKALTEAGDKLYAEERSRVSDTSIGTQGKLPKSRHGVKVHLINEFGKILDI